MSQFDDFVSRMEAYARETRKNVEELEKVAGRMPLAVKFVAEDMDRAARIMKTLQQVRDEPEDDDPLGRREPEVEDTLPGSGS